MTALLKAQRYTSHGLAHSAADDVSAATGEDWHPHFRPRWPRDPEPFVITETVETMEEAA